MNANHTFVLKNFRNLEGMRSFYSYLTEIQNSDVLYFFLLDDYFSKVLIPLNFTVTFTRYFGYRHTFNNNLNDYDL